MATEEIDDDDARPYDRRTWEVPRGAGRLDRALADAFPDLSRARIQALVEEGRVTLDGEVVKASIKPYAGSIVVLDIPAPRFTDLVAEDIPLHILHVDEDVVVLAKPAGMVVHPSPGHAGGTLVNALLHHVPSLSGIGGEHRPGIVHRLDAGTSGVMIVARNDIAHRHLAEQFRAHTVDRRYLAVVHRVPRFDQGTVRSELGRDPKDRLKIASVEGGRSAVTHWKVLARGDRVALVEARLETGRTHQVRVHLSESGHPIVGDVLYARRECVSPASIRPLVDRLDHPLLHAWHLGFEHPRTGAWMAFAEPPPADLLEVCAAAGLVLPKLEPQRKQASGV